MKRVLALLFVCLPATASTLKLRSLSDVAIHHINTKPSSATVFLLFQKDCHACRKQVKELSCLTPNPKVLLVGMFSSEKDLRVEYDLFNTKWPGVYGGIDFKKAFQIQDMLTPQVLIVQEEENILITGFTKCSEIASYISKKEKI